MISKGGVRLQDPVTMVKLSKIRLYDALPVNFDRIRTTFSMPFGLASDLMIDNIIPACRVSRIKSWEAKGEIGRPCSSDALECCEPFHYKHQASRGGAPRHPACLSCYHAITIIHTVSLTRSAESRRSILIDKFKWILEHCLLRHAYSSYGQWPGLKSAFSQFAVHQLS